jgi:hypothetical protein
MSATEESIWLSEDDVRILTDRKIKSLQIEQLRKMGIQFYVNASGRPVVARKSVEGGVIERKQESWKPNVLMR